MTLSTDGPSTVPEKTENHQGPGQPHIRDIRIPEMEPKHWDGFKAGDPKCCQGWEQLGPVISPAPLIGGGL